VRSVRTDTGLENRGDARASGFDSYAFRFSSLTARRAPLILVTLC